MFSSGPNYSKLKTNLRLSIARLKLLEKKKAELAEKSRREISDFLRDGKIERAKIRVEYIIREDYLVEAMEIVEMYCDLLLARFGLITNMKELDEGLSEAVASLIWVAPRLQSDCTELKVIADLLTAKYGHNFAEACRVESIETVNQKLKTKLAIQSPPKILVEKYVIEIARSYGIPYEPDPQVMQTENGKDALLIDLSDRNNLGGGGMPAPPGFFGYPQPPPLPAMDQQPTPFHYPPRRDSGASTPSAPPPAFSYNIPPGGDEKKETNVDFMDNNLPTYSMVYPNINFQGDEKLPPDDNLQNNDHHPKPAPRTKFSGDDNLNLPDLPSVPNSSGPPPAKDDDIDFDDLTKRFNELKKRN